MSFLSKLFKRNAISASQVDREAMTVLRRLNAAGHVAYLVGGGVRDLLLGRVPKDFDVATSATPYQIKSNFRHVLIIGRRFRLALVCFGPDKQIETATFRRDPGLEAALAAKNSDEEGALYQSNDNAWGTPEQDALRRDFTVNALFWDPVTGQVIDYVGGLKDLHNKVLRSIGDPNVRFREDPVRMLRAVRLGARLGFTIHKDSLDAIHKYRSEIAAASRPRLFEEILRLFTFAKSREALGKLFETGLMEELLPRVDEFVKRTGGAKSPVWAYLQALDDVAPSLDTENRQSPQYIQENVLRLAVLLTPLWREIRAAKPQCGVRVAAEELVREVLVLPYSTQGWRIPRMLCQDLESVLVSLENYPSLDLHRRSAFSLPWFYTALTLWKIDFAASKGRVGSKEAVVRWEEQFMQWLDAPHPPRRGRYVPTDPDKAGPEGFPGDVPEDRDALFPQGRKRRRPRRRPQVQESGSEARTEDSVASASSNAEAHAPSSVEEGASSGDSPAAPQKRRRRRRGGHRHRRWNNQSGVPAAPESE